MKFETCKLLIIFLGSGYDKSHMIPSRNHRRSQEEANSTDLLSNICLMVGPGMNRQGGPWCRLEEYVIERAEEKEVECVITIAGPAYEATLR